MIGVAWDPAYRRNWGHVQLHAMLYLHRRDEAGSLYGLAAYLWALRAGRDYALYARALRDSLTGRAREILDGVEETLLARAVRLAVRALASGAGGLEGEAEQIAGAAAALLEENPGDWEALVALSLASQVARVKLCVRLAEAVLRAQWRAAEALLGLRPPSFADVAGLPGVFAFDRPGVEVTGCEEASGKAGKARRRGGRKRRVRPAG